MKTLFLAAIAITGLSLSSVAGTVIYDVRCTGTSSGAIAGTQTDIAVNLPGGSWYTGGGWEWSNVEAHGSNIALGEEKADACLPIESTGTYVRPTAIQISARLAHSQGAGGIGFWPEPVLRSTYYPKEDNPEETEKRNYNAAASFTGILLNQKASTPFLQLAEAGKAVGPTIPVTLSGGSYDELSYTVNLLTGELVSVFLNGELITGFPATTAFTESIANYAGAVSWAGGRTQFTYLTIEEGKLDAHPEISVNTDAVTAYTGKAVQATVSGRRSDTHAAIPVSVVSFDGDGDYTFADGVFGWTSTTAGVYTVTFRATLDDENADASVVFTVIDPPEGDTSVIYVAVPLSADPNKLNGTQLGLVTNLPDAVWISGGGWTWSNVRTHSTYFDLEEEHACVCLPTATTNAYVRPATFTIRAKLHVSSNLGGVGFWDVAPLRSGDYDDGNGGTVGLNYNGTVGFTGILLCQSTSGDGPYLQLVENGSAKGKISVTLSGDSYDEVAFTVDTTTGELLYVFLNGEQVLGFPESTAFTVAATQFAGFLSWNGSRATCSYFSLTEGETPSVTPVLNIGYLAAEGYVGSDFSVAVSAINHDTLEAVPVEVVSFDGPAYALADGAFSWTSAATGTFTATFRATIGTESIEKSVTFTVDPIIPVLMPERPGFAAYVGDTVSFGVTALNPATETALPVVVDSFDGGAYTFADGTFSWTSAATGTYHVAFSATAPSVIGDTTVSTNLAIMVYNHPTPLTTCTPVYRTDTAENAKNFQYAGSTWTNTESRTSSGLVVNAPEGVWTWGSGYNWAAPSTDDKGRYGLGDENSSIMLPLGSNGDYVKPMRFKVETTFSWISGMCLVGFWTEPPFEATGNAMGKYEGFTGFRINGRVGTLQLYYNGAAQGEAVDIPFLDPAGEYTFSFVVNTYNGTVDYVTWEGFLAGEFPTTAFTDAATAYVGFGTGANGEGGANARGTVSFFEVSVPAPECTLILLR